MRIVVINLDRDAARLDWMRGQLAARGLAFERFPALTPETAPEDIRTRFGAAAGLSPGEIGCFASHLRVAQLLLESDDPCWLVLEDDVEIGASAEEFRTLAAAAVDQTLVKLSDWPKAPALELKRAGRFRLVRYWSPPRGTGAHFLTRRGAEALLACARGIDMVADDFIRRHAHSRLGVTGVVPPPAIQDRFRESSIDPDRKRETAPRRRRRPAGAGRRKGLAEVAAALRRFGVRDAARLSCAFVAMKARRVKRDTEMRYVLPPRTQLGDQGS